MRRCQSVLSLPRGSISKDTFPLSPDLARRLSAISDEIHHGRGVAVVRGLDSAVLNDEESVIAFAGLASYVCPERATDSYANQTLSKPHRPSAHISLSDGCQVTFEMPPTMWSRTGRGTWASLGQSYLQQW